MYAIQVIEDDIDRGRFCEGGKTVIYILLKETRSVIVVGQELTFSYPWAKNNQCRSWPVKLPFPVSSIRWSSRNLQ